MQKSNLCWQFLTVFCAVPNCWIALPLVGNRAMAFRLWHVLMTQYVLRALVVKEELLFA